MQITETRKAIIELIEPYMNKTKSQFALVTHEKYDGKIQQLEMELDNYTDWFIKECKVIGHYDITAVLKFFHTKIPRNYPGECGILLQRQWFVDDVKFSIPFRKNSKKYIPNKTLYLYTEEEDKQLLELLLKLK